MERKNEVILNYILQITLMKLSTFICGLFINLLAFGQQPVTTNLIDVTTKKPAKWSTYVDLQNLKIEYKFVDCNPSMGYDQELLLFKFTNKSDAQVSIAWHAQQYYGGTCKTCNYPDEYGFSLVLEAGESDEGSCALEAKRELVSFSKFTDINYHGEAAPLTSFQLNGLIVTTIENN